MSFPIPPSHERRDEIIRLKAGIKAAEQLLSSHHSDPFRQTLEHEKARLERELAILLGPSSGG